MGLKRHIRQNGSGAAVPVTSFSDPFIGGARTLAGNGYYPCFSVGNTIPGAEIDNQLNFGGAGGIFGSGSGVNDNGMRTAFYPSSVDPAAVRLGSTSRGMFAQWTLVSRTAGVDCACGLILMGESGSDTGYQILTRSESTVTEVNMGLGSAVSYQVRANAFNSAPNDVIRCEIRVNAGSNEIKMFQNGVLQTTDNDANGARPTTGLFGWGFFGVFTGVIVMKNFSAGLL